MSRRDRPHHRVENINCQQDQGYTVTAEDLALIGNGTTVVESTIVEILGSHLDQNREALMMMYHIAVRGLPGCLDLLGRAAHLADHTELLRAQALRSQPD